MSAKMTVTEMLETLWGQMELHRSHEEFHGQQETGLSIVDTFRRN